GDVRPGGVAEVELALDDLGREVGDRAVVDLLELGALDLLARLFEARVERLGVEAAVVLVDARVVPRRQRGQEETPHDEQGHRRKGDAPPPPLGGEGRLGGLPLSPPGPPGGAAVSLSPHPWARGRPRLSNSEPTLRAGPPALDPPHARPLAPLASVSRA